MRRSLRERVEKLARKIRPARWFASLRPVDAQPTRKPVLPPKPTNVSLHAPDHHRAVLSAACDLPDDTPVDESLLAAISAEMDARRLATGTTDGPANPRPTNLRVRRRDLPDWWEAGRNLFLCAPDVSAIQFAIQVYSPPPKGAIVVVGATVTMPLLQFGGDDSLVVIGDRSEILNSAFTIGQDSTVLIGERMLATWMLYGDVRNGGVVLIGDQNMWATGISFQTDDTHAIRDVKTGTRLNIRGGRIVVDRHVWVGDRAKLMGDCYVGHDGIVGTGAFVRNRRLPANAVSVGRPAKAVRHGVTWTLDDDP